MVVTRNSQYSTKPTEVESINKLIAKRKEEKRKKKKKKQWWMKGIAVLQNTSTSPQQLVHGGYEESLKAKTSSSKRHKSIDVDTGIEKQFRQTQSLSLCSTPSSKCRKGNDGSKEQVSGFKILDTTKKLVDNVDVSKSCAVVKRGIRMKSSPSKKKSKSRAVKNEESLMQNIST